MRIQGFRVRDEATFKHVEINVVPAPRLKSCYIFEFYVFKALQFRTLFVARNVFFKT